MEQAWKRQRYTHLTSIAVLAKKKTPRGYRIGQNMLRHYGIGYLQLKVYKNGNYYINEIVDPIMNKKPHRPLVINKIKKVCFLF